MTLLADPCPQTCADFFCLYDRYHAVTVSPCDGTADVAVPRAAFSRLSRRAIEASCNVFRMKDIAWKLHKDEYPDTNSPPKTLVDPDGNTWTVLRAEYSHEFCYWRVESRCIAIDQSLGAIEVGTVTHPKGNDGAQEPTVTWAAAPGLISIDGGFRSFEDDQDFAETQVLVYLDPATFSGKVDWTSYRFREDATSQAYRYESSSTPAVGEPIVIQCQEWRA